jgi:hypothetical protein
MRLLSSPVGAFGTDKGEGEGGAGVNGAAGVLLELARDRAWSTIG